VTLDDDPLDLREVKAAAAAHSENAQRLALLRAALDTMPDERDVFAQRQALLASAGGGLEHQLLLQQGLTADPHQGHAPHEDTPKVITQLNIGNTHHCNLACTYGRPRARR